MTIRLTVTATADGRRVDEISIDGASVSYTTGAAEALVAATRRLVPDAAGDRLAAALRERSNGYLTVA